MKNGILKKELIKIPPIKERQKQRTILERVILYFISPRKFQNREKLSFEY